MALRRSTGFLDKLGGNKTNIVSNGDFATNTTGWTAADSTLSSTNGELVIAESGGANPGQAYQDIATVPGRIYRLTVDFRKGTSATGSVLVGDAANISSILTSPAYSDATTATKTLLFVATGATTRITLQSDSAVDGETSIFDNVVCEEILDGFQEIFRNCKINVYTGTQPASADEAATGTLLYTITLDDDGVTGLTWGESVGGVVSKNPSESWKGTAIDSGIAGWFRCYEEGDDPALASTTRARFDGTVATSGAEINMSNTNISTGAVQTVTSFSYTQPAG